MVRHANLPSPERAIRRVESKVSKHVEDFKEFVMRGNVLDLAFAVIIGVALGAIITSLVNHIVMSPIWALPDHSLPSLGDSENSSAVAPRTEEVTGLARSGASDSRPRLPSESA